MSILVTFASSAGMLQLYFIASDQIKLLNKVWTSKPGPDESSEAVYQDTTTYLPFISQNKSLLHRIQNHNTSQILSMQKIFEASPWFLSPGWIQEISVVQIYSRCKKWINFSNKLS